MQSRGLRTGWQLLPGRRLSFEELERRDLLTVMRIVDWNTLNGPNNTTEDANFRTVLEAIGNETVQGNTQRVDILALEETDAPGSGDSIGRVQTILNSLYSISSYSVVVSPIDGGGDSTGFVYDTSTVSLLESVQVGAGTLTHNVMRGKFQPVDSPDSSIFYVYSIHLKSGTSGSDAALRGSEAAFLRADADALGEGTQVLFVGDFNMKGSEETAWTNIVAAGPAQLQDVANAPGHWNDNAAFKTLHSQDPRTTMDDRFDIQFASGELFDGLGVDYVSNSFHIFGNNGTHTLNQPITTGSGASADVLNALVAASDHLPAVADYEILTTTPSVRVSQTLGGTKVVEGGLYDTYQLVLGTAPTANVVVTVSPDSQVDVGNGPGVSKQFTFTPANALTPQTVVVHAVDDTAEEGDHTGLLTHTVVSSDAVYNGLSITNVVVSIVDNDSPKIVINELDSDQVGTDPMEFVELYDGGVGNAALDGYFVVFFNGNSANNGSYASFNLNGQHTNADGFFVLGNSGVTPAPDVTFSDNTLQNGADGVGLYHYTAAELAITPNPWPTNTGPTTSHLRDAVVYNTTAALDQDLIDALNPGHPQLNENQNSLGTTQSLSRVPDGGIALDTSKYVAQTPTPGTFNQALPFGVLILQSASRVDVEEGGATDSYQLALLSIPTANVQITVDPDSQTDLGAGAGAAIVLAFTPANALIPQTVTVTAVNDLAVEGNHTSVITHTVSSIGDSNYNGLAVSNVVANIADRVFLPGDYNANSSVDAADYVLWRKTLGTNNPQADGSGPTVGVPNGVVDQADYTYWRANFGTTGIASGAASRMGAGEFLVSPAAVEMFSTASNNRDQSAQLASESVVDSTASDLSFFSAATTVSKTTHTTLRSTSSMLAASSIDPLLSIIGPAATTHSFDDTFSLSHESSDSDCEAVDELFATLESSDLLAESGLLSAFV